jgi:ABC-type multidrug transport system, ATPase component
MFPCAIPWLCRTCF